MRYRRWGRTGLQVSEIGLGTMAFGRWIDSNTSAQIIDIALDQGINLIDTADVYSRGMDNGDHSLAGESEAIIGEALKGRRDQVVLATKVKGTVGTGVNDQGLSRYHIFRAAENSLRRLNTDYIDIYQVHGFDQNVPLEETLEALNDLVRQGKVRYLGCSNYAAWQLAKAHGVSALHGWSKFEGVQPEYSLITRDIERELVPFVQSERVGVISYSPLGRGILTGKYRKGEAAPEGSRLAAGEKRLELLLENNPAYELVEALLPFAENKGWTLAQLALVWVLSHDYISSAIAGVSKPEQLIETLRYAEYRLSRDELAEIDRIIQSPR